VCVGIGGWGDADHGEGEGVADGGVHGHAKEEQADQLGSLVEPKRRIHGRALHQLPVHSKQQEHVHLPMRAPGVSGAVGRGQLHTLTHPIAKFLSV
jgi:hypothetical protein